MSHHGDEWASQQEETNVYPRTNGISINLISLTIRLVWILSSRDLAVKVELPSGKTIDFLFHCCWRELHSYIQALTRRHVKYIQRNRSFPSARKFREKASPVSYFDFVLCFRGKLCVQWNIFDNIQSNDLPVELTFQILIFERTIFDIITDFFDHLDRIDRIKRCCHDKERLLHVWHISVNLHSPELFL